MTAWIRQLRGPAPLAFANEVGPLVDGDYVVGHWVASGAYRGGFPGADAEPGTQVRFAGTDILRLDGGRAVEYRLNSDTGALLAQIGART